MNPREGQGERISRMSPEPIEQKRVTASHVLPKKTSNIESIKRSGSLIGKGLAHSFANGIPQATITLDSLRKNVISENRNSFGLRKGTESGRNVPHPHSRILPTEEDDLNLI
jgi:hypothetical protein